MLHQELDGLRWMVFSRWRLGQRDEVHQLIETVDYIYKVHTYMRPGSIGDWQMKTAVEVLGIFCWVNSRPPEAFWKEC